MKTLMKLALASLMLATTLAPALPAFADQGTQMTPAPAPADTTPALPPPSSALTARFARFLTDVLAGRVPSSNVSQAVRNGLTPQLLAQIRGSFAALGTFRRLEYVRHDAMQGYQQYHYTAMFSQGSQGVMFVTDSSGAIAGFFQDPSANGPAQAPPQQGPQPPPQQGPQPPPQQGPQPPPPLSS
jgi:hypothetical protein